jgi:hypothetical protein
VERHQRRLAGAGRGGKNGAFLLFQRSSDGRQDM